VVVVFAGDLYKFPIQWLEIDHAFIPEFAAGCWMIVPDAIDLACCLSPVRTCKELIQRVMHGELRT
jgi:hypothetical protein